MKPIEKKVWSELETFARAMQRGARVLLSDGNTVTPGADPTGVHVSASVLRQYPIKEIIEPTVLRDWTTEDAKKHIGCMWMSPITGMIGFVGAHDDLRPWKDSQYGIGWSDRKYARPIPGTDPAKWDWKPCKVEVAAPAVPAPYADAKRVLSGVITALGTIHPGEFHKFAASVLADLSFVLSGIEQESP